MSEWKTLESIKEQFCPLISAHTVKQANKYVECAKEKCMWWNKCKGLDEEEIRPHGEWNGKAEDRIVTTRYCTSCGVRGVVGNFCMWCGASMRKEGDKNESISM